jgi:hypothetical protein
MIPFWLSYAITWALLALGFVTLVEMVVKGL